ncbi:MAG: ATP-binding cassette domain-containing protein, partial [Oscillospiraceae bacterium]
MNNFIEANKIWFSYNTDADQAPMTVLSDFSISVKQGEFVAILGHNGCGKSTLAKHFNAILLPQGGKVFVGNMDTSDDDRLYEIRQNV